MSIELRALREADYEGWDLLWQGYLAFYGTKRPRAYRRSYFARLLSGNPHDYAGLVAARGGRLVGLAHYLFHAHGWQSEPVCYLQDLYAAPEARGSGVGRALIEAVYAEADKKAASGVYWTTQDFNETARRLYDRVGRPTPFIKYERP
ncbi:MAG: GNAT family N-acetyltransferase [Paracoccaceae bacterium]|nr:GNAT family N-acetyltransferase [Paracoccaceae bacterium]